MSTSSSCARMRARTEAASPRRERHDSSRSIDIPCRTPWRSCRTTGSTAMELAADALDVRRDRAVVDDDVGVAHQCVAVLHVARMARERMHHPELGERERHALRRATSAVSRLTSSAKLAALERCPRSRAAPRAARCAGTAPRSAPRAAAGSRPWSGSRRRRGAGPATMSKSESRADRKMIGSVGDIARSSRHSVKPPSGSSPRPTSTTREIGKARAERRHRLGRLAYAATS